MKQAIITHSALETEQLGEKIGMALHGNEVIELVSDLGGGKTTFTRGLARGFGSSDRVASPSFTISREYVAGDKRMYHFDLYRLEQAGILSDEINELVSEPDVVVVIEWADVANAVLPDNRIKICIRPIDDVTREISIFSPENIEYLYEGTA